MPDTFVPQLFTVEELAHALKVDERTVRREIERERLKCVRVRRAIRVTRAALDAYLGAA